MLISGVGTSKPFSAEDADPGGLKETDFLFVCVPSFLSLWRAETSGQGAENPISQDIVDDASLSTMPIPGRVNPF